MWEHDPYLVRRLGEERIEGALHAAQEARLARVALGLGRARRRRLRLAPRLRNAWARAVDWVLHRPRRRSSSAPAGPTLQGSAGG